MSLRGASALALGALAYLAAWAFGSVALAVVGVGCALAGAAALVWARSAREPVAFALHTAPAPAVEGDRIRVRAELERRLALPGTTVSLLAEWPRLGRHELRLRGTGRRLHAEARLDGVPRGVHRAARLQLVVEDPLGLERVTRPLAAPTPVVVRPRVVELDSLFADGVLEGAAARLRRPRAGAADLRSVRAHREGEPLRAVHWPSTARRGVLMVKELEEATGGETVVLLDCDPLAAVGEPPDTPFEAAVRAAGSILVTLARRGRTATLLTTRGRGGPVRARAHALDDALDALAAVEADATAPLGAVLAQPLGPLASAREVVAVTARADGGAGALLRARASALVWIDAASWLGRPQASPPGLLALAAAGVPVTTLRRGDDLAAALGGAAAAGRRSLRG